MTSNLDPKKMCDGFLENKPAGVFAMTWDNDGNVEYYSTHGENKEHFVRSNLMYFLSKKSDWGDDK